MKCMDMSAKTFPGGNGKISVAVQGNYGAGGVNDGLKGYSYDDAVSFYNPANLARLTYDWREHHVGISITHTELKMDGLSVTDEMGATARHSGRDKTMLINMFDTKLADFGEQYARSLNRLLWGDGTADAKGMHGLRHFIVEDPRAGTVGGMNRSAAANKYIRNRARTAAHKKARTGTTETGPGAVTSSTANGGALIEVLQHEKRQLVRYGGKPTKMLAGSDFIQAYEREIKANGNYSHTGFQGNRDGAIGPVMHDGTPIEYDPTLDDLELPKRAYWFDPRHIFLMKMQSEWRRVHNPARPPEKFVLYRSITSTGQVVARQLNSALVIDIA